MPEQETHAVAIKSPKQGVSCRDQAPARRPCLLVSLPIHYSLLVPCLQAAARIQRRRHAAPLISQSRRCSCTRRRPTFTAAQAHSQTPPSTALHVVGAGEDRFGVPHSLGLGSILFKVPASETAGGLFVMEEILPGPGGPPLHLHPKQEEWFYVMEGEVAFQVGDQRLHLHAGESVLGPRLLQIPVGGR